ncbi:MAG: endo-1,4-beta-xylanase, partial [Rhodothermia bacterium]|nr:endo-1,4-beta-xylanase [Rhodothermia bacterium]
RGVGPHMRWAYASDTKWDAFRSDIDAPENEVVTISDTGGESRFGINVRWNVEGFGFIFITADNGGDFYQLPSEGQTSTLNLNLELAKSRVARNRRRLTLHAENGWRPSREVQSFVDISENYYEDAARAGADELRAGQLAQKALYHAMWASEKMEMEKARAEISRIGRRQDFFVGCDARSFYHMDPDIFMERFTELFDYATITYYTITGTDGMPDFEPLPDEERFDTRDVMFERLKEHDITVEGRPLFWPYPSVTPDWMRELSYDEVLKYVERHTREVVAHYGDRMYAWEIVNEFHDWANEVNVTPEQTVEITRLACDVARDTAPNVHRLVNNCCPFAEYVQLGRHQDRPAKYPQRTPWEFMKDLHDAGVDFTITGQQMYFPHRDFQDIIMLVERFEEFGRPVQLTEVGTTSGPSDRSVKLGTVEIPDEPYIWRRHWDEELQADWTEMLYTLSYSKPWIEACNWYDFLDGQAFIKNGGLVRDTEGERKAAFHRLKKIQEEWAAL